MTRLFSALSAAGMAFFLSFGVAHADDWSGSWTGPNGGSWSGSAYCAHGVCGRSARYVGPNGGVYSKKSQCGYYGCRRIVSGIGPDGRSWSVKEGVVRGPFRNHGYRIITGPEGGRLVLRRSWRRY